MTFVPTFLVGGNLPARSLWWVISTMPMRAAGSNLEFNNASPMRISMALPTARPRRAILISLWSHENCNARRRAGAHDAVWYRRLSDEVRLASRNQAVLDLSPLALCHSANKPACTDCPDSSSIGTCPSKNANITDSNRYSTVRAVSCGVAGFQPSPMSASPYFI